VLLLAAGRGRDGLARPPTPARANPLLCCAPPNRLGDASAFDPLAGALATHRGELLEDAAAVGGALRELGPMLARARAALAAREAPGEHGGGSGGCAHVWLGQLLARCVST
jgi:hypothetical protein